MGPTKFSISAFGYWFISAVIVMEMAAIKAIYTLNLKCGVMQFF